MTSARYLFLQCMIAAWLSGFAAPGCQNSCPALQKGYEQRAQCREKSLDAEQVTKSPMEQHFGIKTVNLFGCNKYFGLTLKSTDFSLGR